MKIKSVAIKDFKRFTDLRVVNIPETARMVVLVGPNGSGKSSLFEAFNFWINPFRGTSYQKDYHVKVGSLATDNWNELHQKINLKFYGDAPNPRESSEKSKKAFYFRSAYRNEPDFTTSGINRVGDTLDDQRRPQMLISTDTRVSDNYQRIVAETVAEIYRPGNDGQAKGEIREKIIGNVRHAMHRVFGELNLSGPGNPMVDGTFFFQKGESRDWRYKNLSGGEKAAFDLLLDFILKAEHFNDTVFCIDEPELHMHTRLQAKLLDELYRQLPENCQLWIATHSIGMMRKAMELYTTKPGTTFFLDFDGQNFDAPVELAPSIIDRNFWKRVFGVALGDLAELVAPAQIIFCEGKPLSEGKTKNTEFDAKVYRKIFSDKYPDTEFISLGGTNDIEKDAVKVTAAIGQLFTSIKMRRLLDRDDRSNDEIEELRKEGVSVLSHRDVENYLWDDEIIQKLCSESDQPEKTEEILKFKKELLEQAKAKSSPPDDIKSIGGLLYVEVKKKLNLMQCGNNKETFCIATLAPLVTADTLVYKLLKTDIFGMVE